MKLKYSREDLKEHFHRYFYGSNINVTDIRCSNIGIEVEGDILSVEALREMELDEASHQGELKNASEGEKALS